MRISRQQARVRVPATSANLGPGFDSLGLALELHDTVEVTAMAGGLEIEVEGEGAESVPRSEDHAVLRALREGLDHLGAPQIGVRMRCRNRIPHGRGLGSSAAAVVAGLLLARELVAEPEALPDVELLDLASRLEGHPDNAAPALLGGVTVSWTAPEGARAVRLDTSATGQALAPVVLLPSGALSTRTARGLLPAEVPHADAAFTAGRAALLVHALTRDPALLFEATEDRLHQAYRAAAMPQSIELVRVLRAEGHAAVVSGAGPSVLVLGGPGEGLRDLVRRVVDDPAAWRIARMGIDGCGATPVVA
ncbi:homoserine kinase [Brachybacterium sp. EF45031]|uniref:homoserine kinase n=1 Tax=Brachybacterium sillae TaxID=2810536 RepID=UPI00217EA62E|nr:homoserine kinase [Brachybacterium sillae]MCS6710926.1 homoserine kinase [Brachybacterium sillae]